MKEFETNWSREELKAYILIYCSQADFVVSQHETDFINSKVNIDSFDSINNEVNNSAYHSC